MKIPLWLHHNLLLKVSSILLSIVVWTMVRGEVRTTKVFHRMVYQLEIPSSMGVVEKSVRSLKITLAGPRDIMRDTLKNSIRIVHRLKGIQGPGAIQFQLTSEDFILPAGVELLDVYPKYLKVVLDRLIDKELKVKSQFVGNPGQGFQVREHSVNPTIVKVKGPEGKLQKLTEIETQPILLTGRTRSFIQTVALKPLLDDVHHEKVQYVDVYVKIQTQLSKKTFEPVGLMTLQGSKGEPVRFEPSTVKVILEGSGDFLQKISDADIRAYVDVADLKSGKYQLPVNVLPLQGASVVNVYPHVVEVEVIGTLEAVE